MTTMYMNKLTIDIEDNSEIIGNIFMSNVFHFDHHKGLDWKQGSKDYSKKCGFELFLVTCGTSSTFRKRSFGKKAVTYL